jgi:hypothetical protein
MKLIASLVFVILATTQIVHAVEEEINDDDLAEMNRETHYYTKDKTAESYQAKDVDKIDEKIKKQESDSDQPFSGDKYVAPPGAVKAPPVTKKTAKKAPKPKPTPAN